ncbi:MAG: serine/threonine protein kinase, partial [Planctomycetes bacterium]|nr:serine/threonine protein kinase [Planctomycetota bacterium]
MTKQQGGLEQAALIFERARKVKGDARRAYLDEACHGNAALRADILSMLEAEAGQGEFLSDPTLSVSRPISEGPGTVIGHYKLLQLIGEGGFGVVYLAEQTEPVHRKVALKIIKLGMDTKQVIARFEAERQALAMMDHPNIAKVLDAGATDSEAPMGVGRPYFVMELVHGHSLTKYCDTERLDTPQRLELFIQVCNAVQHAHQKGIIHRDIKPSNVMITLHDGKPVPKVIDFGIAKATNARLTERTLFTEYGQLIGTPAYMSPEQAEMSGLDIDTRSDIYSLGVLLYELLTGLTPFDARRLKAAGYDELRRIIREEEPPKPSTRLSGFLSEPSRRTSGSESDLRDADRKPLPHGPGSEQGSSAFDIARFRHTDPTTLSRSLRGDLDWIVMKCLEKDRQRRYETANGLAADIQRHLSNEPVSASPPSTAYRLRKYVRRHKVSVTAATVVAAALVVGIVATSWMAVVATDARNAEAVQREVAEAVNDFLNKDLLAAVNPSSALGNRDVTVREVLDKAAISIQDGSLNEQAAVEAAVRATIGKTYLSLGLYDEAETHLRVSLEIERRLRGDESQEVARNLQDLSVVLRRKGDYQAAEPLARESLLITQQVFGDNHPQAGWCLSNLAIVLQARGAFDEAELNYNKGLAIARESSGEDAPLTLALMNNLANLYETQGRYSEAMTLHEEALEVRKRTVGDEHPHTFMTMSNLANVYQNLGRRDEAGQLHRAALEGRRRVLGPDHPETLHSVDNVAIAAMLEGHTDEAESLFRESLERRTRTLGPDHPATLHSMNYVAMFLSTHGRVEEAIPLLEQLLESRQRILGPEHPDTLTSVLNVGRVKIEAGYVEEAAALVEPVLPTMRRIMGDRNKFTRNAIAVLADLYIRLGRAGEAEPLLRERLD